MKIATVQKIHLNNETFVIKYNANEAGDTSTPETWLEVYNMPVGMEGEISVVGYMLNESVGTPLKVADIGRLDTADGIVGNGIYMILSGGLERVELSTSVECDVIIKQVV